MAPRMPAIDWTTIANAIQAWVVAGSGLAADHVIWSFKGPGRPSTPYIQLNIIAVRPVGFDYEVRQDNTFTFEAMPIEVVDVDGNRLQITGHGFITGDGPIELELGGGATAPAPLAQLTSYWAIVLDANHIQLASTFQNTGGNYEGNPITPIVLESTGSGDLSIIDTDDTVHAGIELENRARGTREVSISMQCFPPENSGLQSMQIMTDVGASLQLHIDDLDAAGFGVSDLNGAYFEGGAKLVEGRLGSILEPRTVWTMTGYVASEVVGFETFVEKVSVTFTETSTDTETTFPVLPPP
jgi:hypothetical protein